MDAGQILEAIAAFTQCAEIYQRMNKPAKLGIVLEFLGHVHQRQGQYAAALEKYRQVLELKRKYMAPQNVAITEAHIARMQAKLWGE